MKKKNQSYQNTTDFDDFDPVSSSDTSSGFDFGSDQSYEIPDNSFQDSDDFVPPVKQSHHTSRSSQLIAIFSAVIVLLLGVTVFMLLPKNTDHYTKAGTASPAGKTAFINPGCELLLNELLVTVNPTMSQKEIEVELSMLDGAIVGYLPVLNQYQIRFNTDTLNALDEKKTALDKVAGISRTDYNYLLTLSVSPCEIHPYALPAVHNKTLGLLGGVPPESSSDCFLLPSASAGFDSTDQLLQWISSHKSNILSTYRADQAVALLNQLEPQFFASCFFFETNQNGTISGYTTSCALRYQLLCLIDAGADTIAIPFTGPQITSSEVLSSENKLNELFLQALEKSHPSFVLCKSWQENDFLISTFTATETGKRHLISVSPFSGDPLSILDAAHTNKQVFLSAAQTSGSDIAAYGDSNEASVILAASQLAYLRSGNAETDPSLIKKELIASCSVLVAHKDGVVIPGLNISIPGNNTPEQYKSLTLKARDSRTGQDIHGITYTVETQAGSFAETSSTGELTVLLPDGRFSITASADNYHNASISDFPDQSNDNVLYLTSTQPFGILSGRVNLRGGFSAEDLRIRFRNTQTGIEGADMPLSPDYRLEITPGNYELIISGRNGTSATVYGVNISEGAETVAPNLTLSLASDLPGIASGMIKDAMTGGPLEGVNLNIFEGVSTPESYPSLATAVTDNNGCYSSKLPGGVYTAYISKTGYRSDKMQIIVEGEKTIGDQDCTITPTIPDGYVRIVLDWGRFPDDLDSHLVNRLQGIHTFYSNKTHSSQGADIVTLDVDALGEMLPDKSNRVETTTIHKQLPGKYTFYIHDYSNQFSTDNHYMAESGAKVTVFLGGNEETKYVFEVPDKIGTLWEVFTLENGILTPSGAFTNHQDAGTVGQ